MNTLPDEIQDIIWNIYWQNIYTSNIINELKNINKSQLQIYDVLRQNFVFNIDEAKKKYYQKLNIIIKDCYYNNSFKLVTSSKFFKKPINFNILNNVKDEYKYIAFDF